MAWGNFFSVFFLEGKALQKYQEHADKVLTREVHGTAGGMADIAHGFSKLPHAPVWPYFLEIGTLGPSEEDWKKVKERHKKESELLRKK